MGNVCVYGRAAGFFHLQKELAQWFLREAVIPLFLPSLKGFTPTQNVAAVTRQ